MSKVEIIVKGDDPAAVRLTTQLIAETFIGEDGIVLTNDNAEMSIDDFHEHTPTVNGFVASEAEFPEGIQYTIREQVGFINEEVPHE